MMLVMLMVNFSTQQENTGEESVCSGSCQRMDRTGRCRTLFNCVVTEPSIFHQPCRRHCYSLVRGRCRLKFSCLLGR
ncbi:hypothetical protein Pmani_007283 [Petrolisthes manimaculis]|uniref:Uncharacterized protein n=1 Tax=Petrolisthes manimaculis TaxID=1843537 RepID=A0AAE1UIV5_9EUCA|nr:hypothetical protein Pmani_007283 [Petrolisthes manimaculis]